ncbi:MAG: STN domain-containing protein [Pseudomonadota bacterium]
MCRADVQRFLISSSRHMLRGAVFAIWLGLCVGKGFSALAGEQYDAGPDRWIVFDIPAQPLAHALDSYGRATGMAVLVDQSLTSGRRSADVEGMLTPDQALRIMIAGSGLSIRYAGDDAFTLEPMRTAAQASSRASSGGADRDPGDGAYFADVQDSLMRALCRRPETQPGHYRLGLQLWVGAEGAIRAAHLLDSSGDTKRDVVIVDLLRAMPLAPPPRSLPQPITIVLLPQDIGPNSDCRGGGELRR